MVTGWPSNVLARSLYLYENKGIEAHYVQKRDLYVVENKGVQAHFIAKRDLYLVYNRGINDLPVLARDLYVVEALRDGEVFPWLMRISPTEQYRGGTVELYGDGFGELLDVTALATVSTSSVSGGNVGDQIKDRLASAWISTSGAAAWVRFTFAGPQRISAVALADLPTSAGTQWGRPRFRFSDAGADVDGTVDVVPQGSSPPEYPVGIARSLYSFAPRTVTWIEVAIVPATGGGTNRGLTEAWVFTDTDQTAESSTAILNDGLVTETPLGIVVWANRSPGLYPANGGLPILSAATVTIPNDAESGLVVVEESI